MHSWRAPRCPPSTACTLDRRDLEVSVLERGGASRLVGATASDQPAWNLPNFRMVRNGDAPKILGFGSRSASPRSPCYASQHASQHAPTRYTIPATAQKRAALRVPTLPLHQLRDRRRPRDACPHCVRHVEEFELPEARCPWVECATLRARTREASLSMQRHSRFKTITLSVTRASPTPLLWVSLSLECGFDSGSR